MTGDGASSSCFGLYFDLGIQIATIKVDEKKDWTVDLTLDVIVLD